jgi:uncharacterized protein (DUF1697 family)
MHVALLRAVNVGARKLAMSDARAICEDLGFCGVASLRQSGNLIFDSGRLRGSRLEAALEEETVSRLGLRTQFIVRTASEWSAAVQDNPLQKAAKEDPARTVIVAFKDPMRPSGLQSLRRSIRGPEVVASSGRHLYAYYPDGQGRSKLSLSLIEKHVGTQGTARNWNTAVKILTLLQ